MKEKYFGVIYKAVCKVNNKIYIGQTIKSLAIRKGQHIHGAFKLNKRNKFSNALRKYGKENFDWYIIHFVKEDEDINQL